MEPLRKNRHDWLLVQPVWGNPYDSDQDIGAYIAEDLPAVGVTELTEEEAAAIASYESYFLTERGRPSLLT